MNVSTDNDDNNRNHRNKYIAIKMILNTSLWYF